MAKTILITFDENSDKIDMEFNKCSIEDLINSAFVIIEAISLNSSKNEIEVTETILSVLKDK